MGRRLPSYWLAVTNTHCEEPAKNLTVTHLAFFYEGVN